MARWGAPATTVKACQISWKPNTVGVIGGRDAEHPGQATAVEGDAESGARPVGAGVPR